MHEVIDVGFSNWLSELGVVLCIVTTTSRLYITTRVFLAQDTSVRLGLISSSTHLVWYKSSAYLQKLNLLQFEIFLSWGTHVTQRSLLNHQGHDLVKRVLQQVSQLVQTITRIVASGNLLTAAAIVVSSALVSYAGATSTISAAIRLIPSSPRMIVRSSRVVHPPVSGVPVAGATI